MKTVSAKLPVKSYVRFMEYCAGRGMSLSEGIRDLVGRVLGGEVGEPTVYFGSKRSSLPFTVELPKYTKVHLAKTYVTHVRH